MAVIEDLLKRLPERPGVYLMKDRSGQIIYVGKARSLKHRVRSYFQPARNLPAKVLALVDQVGDLDYITTDSEVEALILESNLIKRHRPKYNIKLRDDKHYPYLKLTLNETWPRVVVTRGIKKDGAKYFGPYTYSQSMRETLRLLRRLFPLRTCTRVEAHQRPCLEYQIGRCLGPCQPGYAGREGYDLAVKDLISFLEGKQEELLHRLRQRMDEAAEGLQFERAAELRDQIQAVEKIAERQKIISSGLEDQDVIGWARDGDETCVQVFFVREGKLVGREHFILAGTEGEAGPEVLEAFLKQFYSDAALVPPEILLPDEPEDRAVLEEWLARRRGGRVHLRRALRGRKREMLAMVEQNARLVLENLAAERERAKAATDGAIDLLQQALGLPTAPRRIEGFDISDIMGDETVASMVVFQDGKPKRSDYRRFRIRTVQGPNDFAAMAEAVERRFHRGLQEREALAGAGGRPGAAIGEVKFAELPDLLIIDGGKGQLSAAREVMGRLGVGHIPAYGLAKENEWLFAEGAPDPIVLPRDSKALFLLQRLRDEAHRFAITYHRKLHGRAATRSLLDDVPGIGAVRKKALLRRFGSLRAIRAASVDELAAVEGMTRVSAEKVKEFLGGE